jgi:hypothetical protein
MTYIDTIDLIIKRTFFINVFYKMIIGKDMHGNYYKLGDDKYYYVKGNKNNKKLAISNFKKYIISTLKIF